ncbi:hypothetical protein BZA05DRAFT_434212 [Tricharina praecox]|uniref:uncharacterized protein n=1 Tax=Tricharina praecox TaxID=43433 RepID=UPI002220DEEC|nr:uncharacterized protein BZA05DRAFT_434212 [Tricharina praecox]KAI5855719.1 hypothetical protein BZA05DRAFT_434212 [Tricharina praecox]
MDSPSDKGLQCYSVSRRGTEFGSTAAQMSASVNMWLCRAKLPPLPPPASRAFVDKARVEFMHENNAYIQAAIFRLAAACVIKTITMPQLLDLPNELLRTVADELTYLPRDYPHRRFQHPIAAFRLTNRRLAEVGKSVFRNFSAVRECPPVLGWWPFYNLARRPFYNFTVRKYLWLLPQQPEFPMRHSLEDIEFLDEITKDLPQNHCLKYVRRIEIPPVIREYESYTHGGCQSVVKFQFLQAEAFLEEPTSALLLRQLPWLRSLTITGVHIESLMRAGPHWDGSYHWGRDKGWDCNYLTLLLLAAPKLRNLVAGGFLLPRYPASASSPETHKLLEDLRLYSSHGYQYRPADAVKIRDSIGEFPALRIFTTDYRVLRPGSDGLLGVQAWKDVFNGELRHIERPRSKAHRKKAYDDRMRRRWQEAVDRFNA